MHKKNLVSFMTLLIVLTITAVHLLGGCESKSVEDGNSSKTATIQIIVSPTVIDYYATCVVEATVTVDSSAVSGQTVAFSVSPNNAGFFTPSTVETDDLGIAATVFSPYYAGVMTITAVSTFPNGSIVQSASIEVIGPNGGGSIDIQLGRNLLLANGMDSTPVLITVRDAYGHRVPDSTLLILVAGEQFTDADTNGVWTEGRDWLDHDANGNNTWDPMGIIPSSAITEGRLGQAQVTYISGADAGTVWLKVTVADTTIGGQAEVPIQLQASAQVNSIYLTFDSVNLSVKQTGGIETALLRAYAYDVNGNTVPDGVPISFIITDGPGGGEHLDSAGNGTNTALTDSQGQATLSLYSGTLTGMIRIRAYSDTILSNATQVMVSAGPPAYLTVAAEECNVDFWDNVANMNNVVAVVSDVYLNPVNDSTVVYFWTDEGTMEPDEARTIDLEGIANTKWIAGNNVATADGRVWIYGETAGGNVMDSSMFFNTHWPDTLLVTGESGSILADGDTKYYVWVCGYDLNDNPVIGGTDFEGDANFLVAGGGTLENGCYSSCDRVEIKSKVLPVDYSVTGGNDDGIGAVDSVTYWHPAGAVTSFPVTITTAGAYAVTSSVAAATDTVTSGSVAYFTVTVKDRFGNPLGDHTLIPSVPSGTASPDTIETNAYGEAFFWWVVPVDPGDYIVIASDVDPRGGIVLTTTITVSN